MNNFPLMTIGTLQTKARPIEESAYTDSFDSTIARGTEMDLNTKSKPKQKTIKSLIYKTRGFQITISENPPTRENFFLINFSFPVQCSNRGPLD